jgi:hypothetical protein
MKKTGFLILILFFYSAGLFSKQWIVFFAKEGFFDGLFRQSFGHAYIGLVWEDPTLNQKVLVDCFGFYPKGGIQSSGLFGYMEGETRDDVASLREHDFAVEISEQELMSCLLLKNVWENKKYSLLGNNCIDFMKNYCKLISKLKIPSGFFLLPSTFLSSLRTENENLERRNEITNVVEVDQAYKSKFGFIKRQQHLINEKFKKIKFHKLRFLFRHPKPATK